MLEITSIGSSSRGNCYLLQSGDSSLLLECGFSIKEIRAGLPVRISSLDSCLISHEHKDHSKAIRDLLRMAVDCYMTEGTAGALGIADHHRVHTIVTGKVMKVSGWTILPYPAIHDASEPVGFVIQKGKDKLLYATDTRFLNVTVAGITHLMVECNYVLDLLKENTDSGLVPRNVKNRVLRTHMGLDTLVKYLKKINTKTIKQIWLLHLSDLNSDEERILKTVQGITGKEVIIA
jgi:phosphoribosyl 1,2-cyclic phosphodiesterase